MIRVIHRRGESTSSHLTEDGACTLCGLVIRLELDYTPSLKQADAVSVGWEKARRQKAHVSCRVCREGGQK